MSLNTIVSGLFRAAVVIHFACLYVLIFGMTNTLGGMQHYRVAVALTILMIVIAVLFVTDMATRRDSSRRFAKVIDAIVGCVWISVVAVLIRNSLRVGEVNVYSVIGLVLYATFIAAAVLFGAKLFGRVRRVRSR